MVSCDCISIKYKKLELIPHCCIKVTAPERNSRDYGKKHDEFLYKAKLSQNSSIHTNLYNEYTSFN